MKMFVVKRKITLSILMMVVLLCGLQSVSYSQICQVGDVLRPGESCTDPGTGDDFSVLANGSGRYLFFTSGRGINLRGNINGKQRNFVANKQNDGSWKIEAVTPGGGGTTARPQPVLTEPKVLVVDPDSPPIYWIDITTNKIQRANLDGSNVQDLVTQGLRSPIYIALDVAGGKMYWTDNNTVKIQRANLDGSNVQDLVTRTQGLRNPIGIALDIAGGKMYWTDWEADRIQRANLDGSNVEDLVTRTQGLAGLQGIALDVAGGKMYWTDLITVKIQRANLDGSNIEDLVTQGLRKPEGIALDVAGGKMYWTDWQTDKIQRANLNGSNVEDLVTQGLQDPYGIALNLGEDKMYWTAWGTHRIQRANLDGSNVEDLIVGLDHPSGIALGIPSPKLPPKVPITADQRPSLAITPASSRLTEATLDGRVVTLMLNGGTFEQDVNKIRDALSVSGIPGVTINPENVQRLSDEMITVVLDFDNTRFYRDTRLTFSVSADAITNYAEDVLRASIPVSSWEVQPSIYWVDYSAETIKRADLDGSNIKTLVSRADEPHSIALDMVNGKMYWTDEGWDHVRRADLDGTNVETVVPRQDDPYGIALDVAGGKVYWTDEEWDIIRRANLDGTNVETVVPGLEDPYGIALDVDRGKMYWTDPVTGKIQRANLDGSNIEDLVTRVGGRGLALDLGSGKMYWTNVWEDKIQRANLDGSHIEDLVTEGLDLPNGIALDVAGGKMYWTNVGMRKIQRANLDGSHIEDLVTEGLIYPTGIALSVTPRITPHIRVKEDVNLDGIVDVNDLLYIVKRYGEKTEKSRADVNADGVINIDDLILVAAVIDKAAAAPSLSSQRPKWLTASLVNQWLTEAKLTGKRTPASQRGILFLEQLLAALIPKETALLANYPNPFNPETWIPYDLAEPADVRVTIYDVQGRVVRALDLGHQAAAVYQSRSRAAYWDGKNAVGEPVASGLYFYTLTAGEFSATRKMLIRK